MNRAKMLTGKSVFYFIKPEGKGLGDDAIKVAHSGDTSRSRSKSLADEQTKEGRILGDGPVEESIDLTTYIPEEDSEFYDEATDNFNKGDRLHIWRTVVAYKDGEPEIKKTSYGVGYIEDMEEDEAADGGFLEASLTVQLEGRSVDGTLEIEDLPQGALDMIQQTFLKPDEVGQEEEV